MSVLVLCITIFFCRILDVSLGTFKTVLIVKGKTLFATIIGFVEVFLWFLVVREALTGGETSIWVAFAYAGGFAAGTFLGSILSKLIIKTKINVQIITSARDKTLIDCLHANGFPSTIIDAFGHGKKTERYLIFIEIDSHQFNKLKTLVLEKDAQAFVSVNEVKQTLNGYFVKKK